MFAAPLDTPLWQPSWQNNGRFRDS
jgi:hypothetical protein